MSPSAAPIRPDRMNAPAAATGWHAGERLLQIQAGTAARLAEVGPRILRDHLPPQHRDVYPLLPALIVGRVDAQGQPWASVLAGAPGFVQAPTDRLLTMAAQPLPHDPLHKALRAGAPVGLLGIQPHTGRRNRANGHVAGVDEQGFSVAVAQTFGNCPKYIARHEWLHQPAPHDEAPSVARAAGLDAAMRALIERADAAFIATAHPAAGRSADPAHGVDVSHRGGPRGFLRIEGSDTLVMEDYPGNGFFNTFGNLALNPRCGLLLVDFARGAWLQIAAEAQVVWPASEHAPRGLVMRVTQALHVTGALPLRLRESASATA